MLEIRHTYRILVGKPLEKQPPRGMRRQEDNINIDLAEIVCESGKWMEIFRIMSNSRL
jgi:hypothetical protein